MEIPLTVLIPTHGRPTLLKRTLDSIARCKLPRSYEELVVIENGSRAGAEELVAKLPVRLNARYMHESWGNKSNAINTALETIEDGLVVFFDDDVRVSRRVLVAYAQAAETYDKDSYFGGTVRADRESDPPAWAEERFPSSIRGYELETGNRKASWYLGFNWAAYRSTILQVGGFNILLGPGTKSGLGDEPDLHNRLQEAGARPVDVPTAVVSHYVPNTNTTISWLLQREYKRGIADACTGPKKIASLVSSVLKSTVVFIRYLILLNKKEALAPLLNIAYRTGHLKVVVSHFSSLS